MKVRIVKKTYVELYVYALYALVIAYLVKIIYDSGGANGNPFIIILLILATLRLVPVLPIKRYREYGQMIAENEKIEVECHRRKVSYKIADLKKLNVKLAGYDGQPFYKHMKYLGPREMTMKQLVDGLGNRVRFNYKMNTYKYDLYFEEEGDYEEFKKMVVRWHENHPDIKLNINR